MDSGCTRGTRCEEVLVEDPVGEARSIPGLAAQLVAVGSGVQSQTEQSVIGKWEVWQVAQHDATGGVVGGELLADWQIHQRPGVAGSERVRDGSGDCDGGSVDVERTRSGQVTFGDRLPAQDVVLVGTERQTRNRAQRLLDPGDDVVVGGSSRSAESCATNVVAPPLQCFGAGEVGLVDLRRIHGTNPCAAEMC